jgi:hypothetical protein
LVLEHWIARRRSLNWIQNAFFRLNAVISLIFLVVTITEVVFQAAFASLTGEKPRVTPQSVCRLRTHQNTDGMTHCSLDPKDHPQPGHCVDWPRRIRAGISHPPPQAFRQEISAPAVARRIAQWLHRF